MTDFDTIIRTVFQTLSNDLPALDLDADEHGNAVLTIGNYDLVIGEEAEGGYTYATYRRDDDRPHLTEHITTDGDTTLDSLEATLTSWIRQHA